VKGVGIFHLKLAAAQHAKSRAELVAEFRLNLIQRQRQLLVAFDAACDEFGDDFFMRRAQCLRSAVTVFDDEQVVAIRIAPAGLFPEFDRLQRRQQHFDGTGFVHLITDDVDRLVERAPAHRQVVVHACTELADESCTEHELV
jgi:hypothetical protein